MVTTPQIRAIQTLRRRVEGLDEAAYRAKLRAEFSVVSSKDLTDAQAGRLIEELNRLAGQGAQVGKRSPARRADAPLLQALWISLYELGAARSRDDAALLAFVTRMTGKDHARFLTTAETNRCVEALKQWAERSGVSWSAHAEPKACVCMAIDNKLVVEAGYPPAVTAEATAAYTPVMWDQMMARLGKSLRGVRAVKAKRQGFER